MEEKIDSQLVRRQIEASLAEIGWDPPEARTEIGLHMTDWIDELSALHSFYRDPSGFDAESVQELLVRFLVHVPNHLAAASKLMLDIPVTDVFGVGALDESEEQ